MKIIDEVISIDDFKRLGTILLKDETGNIIRDIEYEKKRVEDVKKEIIRRWLKGEGKNLLIGTH